ncbi:FAD-binding oxidoreductase [Flavobacteriaceae bacterium F89]|uniref:FAD-binding oxidoreductase n=1 Tax=Cerina litoralis TaxID=2874477 RepID=A0AAE3ETC0_9FLAO|nr:FAD-binding oxidoreductase [Cerina litoralis]MCG2459789.1 FAD-binding oxidoreductase [Cerina litoralis]
MESKIEEFKNLLRGELILPRDNNYDETRKVYNGMIDKRPDMIAKCKNTADVITAVNFGRENEMLVSIRGGGHNAAGLGICDRGLVIDLSHICNTRIDPVSKTATVGGGCTWGEVDHATHAFGLATPTGFISTTGVGGLTLGGGIGYLSRKHGLTIDNLLEADMVLADGTFVRVNEKNHLDLFWAIRGGGGNFGVVTSFTFKLHPVKNVFFGPTLWPIEQTQEVMRWYADFLPKAPEELDGFFAVMTVPPVPMFPEELHLKKVCGIVWCYFGDREKADEIFKPIREFTPAPIVNGVQEVPYPAAQSIFDALYPAGLQWYWKADFINELSDEAIALHQKFGEQLPTPHSTMHLYPVDGAVHRVDKNDTAFNFRNSMWAGVIVGVDPDPANKEKIANWAKEYWKTLHPYSAGGAYINFIMEEGEDRIKENYGDNFERLRNIKAKYDPENFFRVNQNIKPANL